jgi:hypothetical protein
MKYYALLCLIIFTVLGMPAAAQAVFTEISGTVEVQTSNSSAWTPAVQGGSIAPHTVISAGFKSSAVITIGSTRVLIRPLTRLTLEEIVQKADSDDVTLFVRTGRIRAEVQPPAGGKTDFTVRSPAATASVRGTAFDFDTVNLRVDSGLVHYATASGQTVYVAQGETAYVDEKDRRVIPPQEIAATGQLPQISQGAGVGTGGAAVHVPPAGELRIHPKWQ